MSKTSNLNRRRFLIGSLLLPALPVVGATLTPRASEGPFYPTEAMRFTDADNDLVKIAGSVVDSGGEVVRIAGKVLDRDGSPVSGAVVEIWQCDVNGRYLHLWDRGGSRPPRDQGFQGFGQSFTADDGLFEFRTIKPVPYPGRTPHIHVKVKHNGRELLTTQLYLHDHPQNRSDFLYQRIPEEQRALVSMKFDDAPEPLALVNLVV